MFSPKGGTGKTVTATNLAASFAKHEGRRTLLLDLDLQFGDAAIMLGLEPAKTIYDLVIAPGELDSEKLAATSRSTRAARRPASAAAPGGRELVTESKLARLLAVARESYDLIIVDTSPFFHGPMLATLDRTNKLLMVGARRTDTEERAPVAADARAPLVPCLPDPLRPRPRQFEGWDGEKEVEGASTSRSAGSPVRPSRAPRGQPGLPPAISTRGPTSRRRCTWSPVAAHHSTGADEEEARIPWLARA